MADPVRARRHPIMKASRSVRLLGIDSCEMRTYGGEQAKIVARARSRGVMCSSRSSTIAISPPAKSCPASAAAGGSKSSSTPTRPMTAELGAPRAEHSPY
jgi:hypothetical protein